MVDEPAPLRFSTAELAPDAPGTDTPTWRTGTPPQPGFTHEGYVVDMRPDERDRVAVAFVNRRLRPELGGLGVYLRYTHETLPTYIAWRMMREGLYAMGMEPATNPFGNPTELSRQGFDLQLEPGERRRYELEFGILAGSAAIDAFSAGLPR